MPSAMYFYLEMTLMSNLPILAVRGSVGYFLCYTYIYKQCFWPDDKGRVFFDDAIIIGKSRSKKIRHGQSIELVNQEFRNCTFTSVKVRGEI